MLLFSWFFIFFTISCPSFLFVSGFVVCLPYNLFKSTTQKKKNLCTSFFLFFLLIFVPSFFFLHFLICQIYFTGCSPACNLPPMTCNYIDYNVYTPGLDFPSLESNVSHIFIHFLSSFSQSFSFFFYPTVLLSFYPSILPFHPLTCNKNYNNCRRYKRSISSMLCLHSNICLCILLSFLQ